MGLCPGTSWGPDSVWRCSGSCLSSFHRGGPRPRSPTRGHRTAPVPNLSTSKATQASEEANLSDRPPEPGRRMPASLAPVPSSGPQRWQECVQTDPARGPFWDASSSFFRNTNMAMDAGLRASSWKAGRTMIILGSVFGVQRAFVGLPHSREAPAALCSHLQPRSRRHSWKDGSGLGADRAWEGVGTLMTGGVCIDSASGFHTFDRPLCLTITILFL